jgi:vacuolar-type H+-ATPase subunit H
VVVSIATGKRAVSFEWLREALRLTASAETSKDRQDAEKEASRELNDARSRLAEMIQEVNKEPASPSTSVFVPGNVSNIRRKLDGILESGEYPQAKAPTLLEKIWGDFVRWLLNSIVKALPSGSSPSAIYLLELTVIAIPCGLLIWWFYPQAAGAETWTIRR